MNTPSEKFRILSIDGGGIKGAYPAGFLAKIEEETGRPICDYFDLITGTSTGGIIALGLAMGLAAKEIDTFYREMGDDIFPSNRRRWIRLLGWLCRRPKYRADNLEKALRNVFADMTLGQARRPVLVPALRARTGKLHVFKTRHHPDFVKDHKMEVAAIARATSAAPLYLPAYKAPDDVAYLDGGLAANNPMLLGIAEAIGVLGIDRSSIRVLSIACPQELLDLPAPCRADGGSVWHWGRKELVGVLYAGQDSIASGVSQYLLPQGNIIRISMPAPKNAYAMDHPAAVTELSGLGADTAVEQLKMLRPIFFDEPAPATVWPN